MNNNSKIMNSIKEYVEKEYFNLCIEELENLNIENEIEWVREFVYVDYGMEMDKDMEKEVEELLLDLKDEYLKGKMEDWEEMNSLRIDLENNRL